MLGAYTICTVPGYIRTEARLGAYQVCIHTEARLGAYQVCIGTEARLGAYQVCIHTEARLGAYQVCIHTEARLGAYQVCIGTEARLGAYQVCICSVLLLLLFGRLRRRTVVYPSCRERKVTEISHACMHTHTHTHTDGHTYTHKHTHTHTHTYTPSHLHKRRPSCPLKQGTLDADRREGPTGHATHTRETHTKSRP